MTSNQDDIILSKGEDDSSPSVYDSEEIKVDKEKLWKKVVDALRRTLTLVHTNSYKREPKLYNDRISFACVFCGDSHKDPRKKRGNLFSTTLKYHCFNGDCNAHMSIYSFLEKRSELSHFDGNEQAYLKKNASSYVTDFRKLKSFVGMESMFSEDILALSLERDVVMKKLGLVEIRHSRIESYLLGRLQKDFQKFAWDPKKGLLYVFNLNSEKDRVLGLQIKTFNKKTPYLTYKSTRMYELLKISTEGIEEKLQKLDSISTVFGILQADLSKPITVFEGPLDSFLFPNSLALCSAKNSLPFDIEGVRYFYDNDDTGRIYSLKRINEGHQVFLWKKYIEENKLYEFSEKKKKLDLNDLLIFMKSSSVKYKPFVTYFSDSKYDGIYV